MADLQQQQASSLGPVPGRQTAHEFVRLWLRRSIVDGSLPGGTRLVQSQIAERLEVSTTPVREAMRDLATEGLIDLDAHRGAVVRRIDAAEAQEIYDLRLLLEPEAMRRAAKHLSGDVLAEAADLQRRMEEAGNDGAVWSELNRLFHRTLVGGVRSCRLATTIRNLQDASSPFVGLTVGPDGSGDRQRTADRDHRELLTALEEGDGDRAATIAARHLGLTLVELEAATRGEHDATDGVGGRS